MYYATAGQQAAQRGSSGGAIPIGGGAFPPITAIGRGGPPGFVARGADPNDFPALGSHPVLSNSSYAAQAQPSQNSPALNPQHPQLAQQMFMQQQQMGGLVPPPPPGIGGPADSSSAHTNGMIGDNLRREDFPALGAGPDGKDRMANYLRSANHNQPPPSPPSTHPNGASASHSNSATPSTNPPHLQSGTGGASSTADSSWPRQSPSRQTEPVVRPVQQIMQSPVDKWGLKALLYEIQTQMGKGDRGLLLFGDELSELGVDVSIDEPLYPSFVTPWAEASQISHTQHIEQPHHIPICYKQVIPPPVQTKLANFAEDTLFYTFYASPQDVLQLEAAEELYNRGWRYHTDLEIWLTSPSFQDASVQSQWLRGPFVVFDSRTFSRHKTSDDFMVDISLLEDTRPAIELIAKSPTANGTVRQGAVN
ncbi:MAG: hypothetical protein TREMPRED_003636 [Tremellales sp. Tagirdzhanova-0007]|nr:MAG: hypothetical protein TREMPRED_003636 [Tremellales sp. Tagirdzhanova-0007]